MRTTAKPMPLIHVTMHADDSKLRLIQSISTPCSMNDICAYRQHCDGSICEKCFAERLLSYRKNVEDALIPNFLLLTTRLLTRDEAAAVNIYTEIGRIESFGDVANVTQARNYIRIIRAHKRTQFGIWSKNWGIWYAAFLKEGKPRNCTFVLSSMFLNKRAEVPERMKPYVNHVFTVWEPKLYDAQFPGTETECAGLSCMKCRKCYKRGGSFYIDERKR